MSLLGRLFKSGGLEHYRQGILLFNRKAYAEAADAFERAILEIQDPSSPYHSLGRFYVAEARAKLGRALFEQGRLDQAGSQFQRALDAGYQYPDLHYLLGRVFDAGGAHADAERHYDQALELNGGYADARAHLVLALWRQQKVGAIAHHLTPLSAAGFTRPAGEVDEAWIQSLVGDLERREEGFEHVRRALEAYQSGDRDAAVTALETAVEHRPDYADLRCKLGILLAENGELDTAEVHLDHALAINPRYVEARLQAGILLLRRGEPAAAIVHLHVAAEREPGYPETLLFLALAQMRAARLAEAIETAKTLRRRHPAFSSGAFLSGQLDRLDDEALLTGRGSWGTAREWSACSEPWVGDLADPARPGSYRAARGGDARAEDYRALGTALLVRGHAVDAETPLEHASRLAPDDPHTALALARTRMAAGDLDGARAGLERLRERVPGDPSVALWYGRALWQTERGREALAVWDESAQMAPEHARLHRTTLAGAARLGDPAALRRAAARLLACDPLDSLGRLLADDAFIDFL